MTSNQAYMQQDTAMGDAGMASNMAYGGGGQQLTGAMPNTSRLLAMLLAADIVLLWLLGVLFKGRVN